jgi:hypothetical protein
MRLHNRVFGTTDPASTFQSTLALFEKFAPELAHNLEGLDATTAAGRAAIEKQLQALVLSLQAGAITLEQYGDLQGAQQLADIIGMLQDSLDSLTNATNAATSSMLNVPEGYKVERARFNATAAQAYNLAPLPPTVGGGNMSLVPRNASSNVTSTTSNGAVMIQGDVYIDAHEQSPEQIFAAVLRVGKRRAAVTFGDSTQWSRVQEA